MRIHVVSDIHGNLDALGRAGEGADQLIVLGDLLDYVDYHDPAGGILGSVFGPDLIRPFIAMRTVGDFASLHRYNQELWATVDDPAGAITEIVAARYRRAVELLDGPTAVILGNVDVEQIWAQIAPEGLRNRDGEVLEFDGFRFGFVGGGSTRPGTGLRVSDSPWKPYIRAADDFAATASALGPVDVLCTHIPPDLIGMRYDTVPARLEMFGPGLIDVIDRQRPSFALSGHVHQPLASRVRRGRTECINVGHFQRHPSPFVLDTGRIGIG